MPPFHSHMFQKKVNAEPCTQLLSAYSGTYSFQTQIPASNIAALRNNHTALHLWTQYGGPGHGPDCPRKAHEDTEPPHQMPNFNWLWIMIQRNSTELLEEPLNSTACKTSVQKSLQGGQWGDRQASEEWRPLMSLFAELDKQGIIN